LGLVKIDNKEGFSRLFENKQKRIFRIGEAKIIIAYFKNEYYAFDYLCPHQKHPLKDAKVTAFGEVVCPLHEYRFSLEYGSESNHKCGPLKRFKLHIKSDGVYLEL
jgi:nitrite reductase/ring-hydroxylating ferredoxin subunit